MSAAAGGQGDLTFRRETDRSRHLLRARCLNYDRLQMPLSVPSLRSTNSPGGSQLEADAHRWPLTAGAPPFQAVFIAFITWPEDIAGLDLLSKLGVDIAHFCQ